MRQISLVLMGLGVLLTVAPTATEPTAETRRWWTHIEALANDSMRGRDTGSQEHRKAQEYVVRHFERNGIRPAVEQGYFQSVPLKRRRLDPQQSRATLTRNGRTQTLRWLQQIVAQPLTGFPPEVAGSVVFIGSDNGASLDTAGKIPVPRNPVPPAACPAPRPPHRCRAAQAGRGRSARGRRPGFEADLD